MWDARNDDHISPHDDITIELLDTDTLVKKSNDLDYEAFRKLVANNEIDALNNNEDDSLLNHVNPRYKKPILLLACEGKNDFGNVDARTVNLLIERGADVNYINHHWYGWEALHYASQAANPNKLKVVIKKLGKDRINTLTTLSENALHILLEYNIFSHTYNVSCQNGVNLKMFNISSREDDRLVQCVQILIEAGIDINHNNFWNETPILIAIRKRYNKIINLLLAEKFIDLDSCRGAVSKKTARELLNKLEAFSGSLPRKRATGRHSKKILFQYLKSGNEEQFLKYNGGKINYFVNAIDGDNVDNASCTMLQYCFRRGLIFWYGEKRVLDFDSEFRHRDITRHRLVDVFCDKGLAKCIQHLLDNGANVNYCSLRKFRQPLLDVAVVKGYFPLVALILGRQNFEIAPSVICYLISELMQSQNSNDDLNRTLTLLLSRLLMFEDSISINTTIRLVPIFENSIRKMNKTNMSLFLKFPGSLYAVANNAKMILDDFDKEVLQNHLDECVENKDDKMCVNYNSFVFKKLHKIDQEKLPSYQEEKHAANKVIESFLGLPILQHFLNHLVFKILVNRKWECLRAYNSVKYFYINLFLYIAFCVLLTLYVLMKFINASGAFVNFVYVLNVICFCLFILKEMMQLVAHAQYYVRDFNNYPEIVCIVSAFLLYFVDKSEATRTIMVLAVLSSNLSLLLLLQQVPNLTKYIVILRTVALYIRYIGFYFIQFIAFAICFYILYSDSEKTIWSELPNKIFETIILFTGTLDAEKIQKTDWFSKFVFILFVLFMAIILHNLLIGLIVTDMTELKGKVKLFEQKKRASFVVRLETILNSKRLKFLSGLLLKYSHGFKFDTDDKYLVINSTDKEMLNDDEVEKFEYVLSKRIKTQNHLKKLYRYIVERINERSFKDSTDGVINKQLFEKLQVIEDKIKNLHEFNEHVEAVFNKSDRH